MVKAELNKKSPLRKLEGAIDGGLGKGNIGVIASKKGIGKTACLVHIATDKLMNDKHVLHVSFSNRVDHIITWYEDIFKEISKKRDLEDAMNIHDEIIRNRVIMNFNQDGMKCEHVIESVKAMMKNGQMDTEAVIIDGFDFTKSNNDEIKMYKSFAADTGVEIWFSDSYAKDTGYIDDKGIPMNLKNCIDQVSVILTLRNVDGTMVLSLIKDHDKILSEDLTLKLDTATLLIAEN